MSSSNLNRNWVQFQNKQFSFNSFIKEYQNSNNDQLKSIAQFISEWLSEKSDILQNTSGSTGKPKSIKILKSQMKASALATLSTLNIEANDHALLCINAEYIGGKMMIARSIIGNLNLIIAPTIANPLKDFSTQMPIEFFSFVPYQFERIIDESPEKIPFLEDSKAIILGGAPVSDSLAEKINTQFSNTKVYSTYGMTETVSHVALKLINSNKEETFNALQNIKFSVDDRNCLVIHAPEISGKDEVVTNDVVNLISSTAFHWLGRNDFVINSGGIKIHPELIEKEIGKIFNSSGISNRFFVFGLPDDKLGDSLNLVLEGNNDSKLIQNLLKKNLKAFHSPREIYTIDKFVETENSKINRFKTIDKLEIVL